MFKLNKHSFLYKYVFKYVCLYVFMYCKATEF